MSGTRLHRQCVAVLVVCYQPTQGHHELDGLELVSHAFAMVWDYDNGKHLPSMVNSQC